MNMFDTGPPKKFQSLNRRLFSSSGEQESVKELGLVPMLIQD